MTEEATPTVRVEVACSRRCGASTEVVEYDREAALDLLDALGWTALDTSPVCPACASGQPDAIRARTSYERQMAGAGRPAAPTVTYPGAGNGDRATLASVGDDVVAARAERDAIAQDLAKVATERRNLERGVRDFMRAVDQLTERIAEVEGERDRMFENGQTAALTVARVRHLADGWARMADSAAAPDSREWLAAASSSLLTVLDGGEPR